MNKAVWTYGLIFRPAGYGTVPEGRIATSPDPVPGYSHGTVNYDRELTAEERRAFQIDLVSDPNGPVTLLLPVSAATRRGNLRETTAKAWRDASAADVMSLLNAELGEPGRFTLATHSAAIEANRWVIRLAE